LGAHTRKDKNYWFYLSMIHSQFELSSASDIEQSLKAGIRYHVRRRV